MNNEIKRCWTKLLQQYMTQNVNSNVLDQIDVAYTKWIVESMTTLFDSQNQDSDLLVQSEDAPSIQIEDSVTVIYDIESENPDLSSQTEAPKTLQIEDSTPTFFDCSQHIRFKLQQLLDDNGLLVRGTCLDYTARPHHESTKFFCAIADFLSKASLNDHEPRSVAQIMYQNLSFSSGFPGQYPDLAVRKITAADVLSDDEKKEHTRLTAIKDFSEQEVNKLLTEIECLSSQFEQLAKEDSQAPELSEWLAQLKTLNRSLETHNDNINQLARLNEKIQLADFNKQHYIEHQGFYLPQLSAQQLVSSHILSKDIGLIPVSMLTQTFPCHVYAKDELFPLTEDELTRLQEYCSLTRQYTALKNRIQELSQNKSALLGHLTLLVRKLQLNDAHGGSGQQEDAGGGAYPALIEFRDYFKHLPYKERKKIPPKLRALIYKLLNNAFDKKRKFNITTCIGTHREHLQAAMLGKTELLSSIACSDKVVQTQIAEVEQQLSFYIKKMSEVKALDRMDGDKLIWSRQLLDSLNIQFSLTSICALNNLMRLSRDEIKILSTPSYIAEQMTAAFKGEPSLFSYFIANTADEKILVYFEVVKEHYCNLPIYNILQLKEIFFEVSESKTSILMSFVTKLSIIKSANELSTLLTHLPSGHQNIILEQTNLPTLFKVDHELIQVLTLLSESQCIWVINKMLPFISQLFRKPAQLVSLLEYASLEQRALIIETMNHSLTKLRFHSQEIYKIITFLSPDQIDRFQTILYKTIELNIKNGDQLCTVLGDPDISKKLLIFNIIKNLLRTISLNSEQLTSLLWTIPTKKIESFCDELSDRLPTIFRSTKDMRYLSLEERKQRILFNKIKHWLPNLIKTNEDLNNLERIFSQSGELVSIALKIHQNQLKNILQLKNQLIKINDHDDMEQINTHISTYSESNTRLNNLNWLETIDFIHTIKSSVTSILQTVRQKDAQDCCFFTFFKATSKLELTLNDYLQQLELLVKEMEQQKACYNISPPFKMPYQSLKSSERLTIRYL